jgi:hypothetical protein
MLFSVNIGRISTYSRPTSPGSITPFHILFYPPMLSNSQHCYPQKYKYSLAVVPHKIMYEKNSHSLVLLPARKSIIRLVNTKPISKPLLIFMQSTSCNYLHWCVRKRVQGIGCDNPAGYGEAKRGCLSSLMVEPMKHHVRYHTTLPAQPQS